MSDRVQTNSTVSEKRKRARIRSTRVHVWWQLAASRPAIFHRGKSSEMVQKGSNHPRFGRAIRAHPTATVSLSFSIRVPFPDYSIPISRTGVYPTVHPTLFSPLSPSIPRTIIPRFISHRQEGNLCFRL